MTRAAPPCVSSASATPSAGLRALAILTAILTAILASSSAAAAGTPVSFRGIAIPDRAGTVMTVEGPVPPAALGLTLPHEHVFIDLAAPLGSRLPGPSSETDRARFGAPFSTE